MVRTRSEWHIQNSGGPPARRRRSDAPPTPRTLRADRPSFFLPRRRPSAAPGPMASISSNASEGDDVAWSGPSMEELEEEARLEAMWTARGEEVRTCVLPVYTPPPPRHSKRREYLGPARAQRAAWLG